MPIKMGYLPRLADTGTRLPEVVVETPLEVRTATEEVGSELAGSGKPMAGIQSEEVRSGLKLPVERLAAFKMSEKPVAPNSEAMGASSKTEAPEAI
jgi:hypothetical protein